MPKFEWVEETTKSRSKSEKLPKSKSPARGGSEKKAAEGSGSSEKKDEFLTGVFKRLGKDSGAKAVTIGMHTVFVKRPKQLDTPPKKHKTQADPNFRPRLFSDMVIFANYWLWNMVWWNCFWSDIPSRMEFCTETLDARRSLISYVCGIYILVVWKT